MIQNLAMYKIVVPIALFGYFWFKAYKAYIGFEKNLLWIKFKTLYKIFVILGCVVSSLYVVDIFFVKFVKEVFDDLLIVYINVCNFYFVELIGHYKLKEAPDYHNSNVYCIFLIFLMIMLVWLVLH